MRAVVFRFRSEWRTRWRSRVALALLVGAVAGTSLLLLSGSRRTGSAHDRFLRSQRSFDVAIGVDCDGGEPSGRQRDARCLSAAAHLPAVQDATSVATLPADVETLDGTSIQPGASDPCYSGPGVVFVVMDESGRLGTEINRNRFVSGRAANPAAADEVVISRDIATRLKLGVGSELRIRLLGGQDCLANPSAWQPAERVHVVGVQLSPGQVRPPSGQYLQTLEVTPAFVRATGNPRDRDDVLLVRLRTGASVDALRTQAEAAGYGTSIAFTKAEIAGTVERAIRPSEVSLLILSALTALAGAIVLGQVLVRHAAVEAADDTVLAALGLRGRERLALAALRSGVLGLLAAIAAVGVAVIASPLMPIGLARIVEPAPGLSVDAVALGLGALATVGFVVGVTMLATALGEARGDRPRAMKPSRLTGFAARAGFSPAAVSGARFALERGSGSATVPVVSSFVGLTIAVAAVAGALTFGAALTHLRSTPRLVGWNWDIVLAYPEMGAPNAPTVEQARARVRSALATDDVSDAAMGTIWSPFPEGRDLQLGPEHRSVGGFVAFDGTARFGPSVISGRKPTAADEILLGPRTLADLGLHVDDRVDVVGQAGSWDVPGRETTTKMRIVGTGLAPMTESLGRGAVVTISGLRRLNPGVKEQAWFVRIAPGADRATVVNAFRSAFPDSLRPSIAQYESGEVSELGLNLEQIGSVPLLFALIMAAMAAAVLAHVLAVATHARRRDLAVLRVLGFRRGQLLRTVVWQSTVYAATAVAIGVPAGVALGRLAWHAYGTNLGVVPEVVTPWSELLAVAVTALVLAVAVAVVATAGIARATPASVLRTE